MQSLVDGYFRVYLKKCMDQYIIPQDVSNIIAKLISATQIDASFFQQRIDIQQIKYNKLFNLFNEMKTQQVNIKGECEILQNRI